MLQSVLNFLQFSVCSGAECYVRASNQIYHEWMKSPELLETTASEPLSEEEEYEMQRSSFPPSFTVSA